MEQTTNGPASALSGTHAGPAILGCGMEMVESKGKCKVENVNSFVLFLSQTKNRRECRNDNIDKKLLSRTCVYYLLIQVLLLV